MGGPGKPGGAPDKPGLLVWALLLRKSEQLMSVDSNGTTSYAWDYENRLTSVALPGTGGTVTFKYDPFGRRVQKVSPVGIGRTS